MYPRGVSFSRPYRPAGFVPVRPHLNTFVPAAGLTHKLFSAVAVNGNFIQLFPFTKKGTIVGTPGKTIFGRMGPAVTLPGGGTDVVNFSGQSTDNDNILTIAAIFSVSGGIGTHSNTVFATASTNTGWRLSTNISTTSNKCSLTQAAVADNTLTGIPDTIQDHIYFLAVSAAQSGANTNIRWVFNDLTSMKYFEGSLTITTSPVAPNGTYQIGMGNTVQFQGRIAAVAYLAAAIPLLALRRWAYDPWAFWYPYSKFDQLPIVASVSPDVLRAQIWM